jgi:hypothetical protein
LISKGFALRPGVHVRAPTPTLSLSVAKNLLIFPKRQNDATRVEASKTEAANAASVNAGSERAASERLQSDQNEVARALAVQLEAVKDR